MNLKLPDSMSKFLLTGKKNLIPKLFFAAMLFSGINARSQCAPAIAGVSNITSTSAKVNWNPVAAYPTATYTLEVHTNAGFTAPFGVYPAVTGTSYALSGLANGTTYYYRVKTNDAACTDFATGSFVAQMGLTPLDVTGFNHDVIANGVGSPLNTTTNSVDSNTNTSANFAYMSRDYKLNATDADLTYGLPLSRGLTSPNVTGLNYILQDYSANNSLRLSATGDFGTLTLSQPASLYNIYLAVASGDGTSTFDAEIQFADSSTQIVTGLSAINWDDTSASNPPVIVTGIGRVKRTTGVASGTPNNFRIFQLTLNIDAANQTKLVNAIKFTKTVTNATESKIPNIFAVSGRLVSPCPYLASASSTVNSTTSATVNWTLGGTGTSGGSVTYTVEVYTDAAYTIQAPGSPFTGLTGTSQLVTGLTLDTPYYYRVRANNGTCSSDYVTGTFTPAYCSATTTNTTLYYISNFTTTGGYTNINNTTPTSNSYGNFSSQIVSKAAGTTFNFNGTRYGTSSTKIVLFADWNGDGDFDDTNETVTTLAAGPAAFSGTITIPAGTPTGNYRLRVRSSSSSTTISACGNLSYSDIEDYTIAVVPTPADCTAPATPMLAITLPTTTGMTLTASSSTPPTNYLLIRSTETTLTEAPVNKTVYAVGTNFGGGIVIANAATIAGLVDFAAPNTHYYYFLYAYNDGGASCLGPIYSTTAATADGLTCANAVVNASASNITSTSAALNWSSVVGKNGAAATYTVEVYTDSSLSNQFGSAITVTSPSTSYNLTGLTNGVTYYYRVKTQTAACFTSTWSAVSSFTAQNNYTPFTVTGFTDDVIANGTGIAKTSTTNDIDAVNNAYMAINYERIAGSVATVGLPLSRTMTTTAIPALSFLFADYSANNSLRLPAQNQVGTLTLATPKKLTNVYLAVTSGSGSSTITSKINFQDGSSQTPITTTTLTDWYGSSSTAQPALISSIGRVNRADNTGTPETGASKVFYIDIPVLAENQTKAVVSIEITKTSTGATSPVPNIFAVSGKQIDECPVMATVTTTPAGDNATINWTLTATSAVATSYTVEVYSDAAMTTPVTGSPFTVTTGTSKNVTGLSPLTNYFFRVKATNTICSSAYMGGTFMTTCLAPSAPTAAATQTVCGPATIANLNATAVSGATLNWYTIPAGGTAQPTTTAITSGNYYVSQTLNSCESTRTLVAVTVNTVNAPVAAAQTVCTGTTFNQLAVTGATGATFTWSATQGGSAITGTTAVTTGTFYVTQTLNGCTSPATSVALTTTTVNPPSAAAQTHCSGTTFSQLTVTGATGATFTWSATQGGTAIAGTTVATSGTYFVTQTVGTCTSTATQVTVTINTTPAPIATAQTFCIGATVANLSATGVTGGTFTWSATQGGTALATTTQLVSGTYFVTQTLNGCTSTPVSVTVTVNSTAAPTATATQTFCLGATVANLQATTLAGATFKWSATEGGTALASTASLTSGTYYITQTLNSCESTATTVTVVVNSTAAPTASAQSFCTGAVASELSATTLTGATVEWSLTESGAAIAENTLLVTGTYYVRQTLNNCVSPSTAVTVVVNTTVAPGADDQTFCIGATVEDLMVTNATGATVNWYSTVGGSALDAATVLQTGTYYVTQTLNQCESTATEIQVTVNTVNAPTVNAQTFCAGATVEDLVATAETNATVNWYSTIGGNTLTPSTVLATGTYYVTQTLNQCESTTTEFEVTINTVNAPAAQSQEFCTGATAAELAATGDAEATLTWYAAEGGLPIAETTLLETGAYYVTQTVGVCTSTATAVNVTVNAIPDAPTGSSTQTFVDGDTLSDLTLTTDNNATVQWYTLEEGVYTAVSSDTLLEEGVTYYAIQSISTCESDYFAVTVSEVTGRDDFKFSNLSVYPNPAKDYITVSNTSSISKIMVINLLGQTVIEKSVNSNTAQIDLSNIASGTYILQVSAEGAKANVKVIKH